MDLVLRIHSSVGGRLGCFCRLAVVNNGAVNTGCAKVCVRPCSDFFGVEKLFVFESENFEDYFLKYILISLRRAALKSEPFRY